MMNKIFPAIVLLAFAWTEAGAQQESDDYASLKEALNHPDITVRLAAVSNLEVRIVEFYPTRESVKWLSLLQEALRNDEGVVQSNAAIAFKSLGERCDLAIMRYVEPLLYDENSMTRYLAAEILGEMGCAAASLIALLKDPDPYMRGFAASALGEIRDGRAVSPLIAMLETRASPPYSRIFAAEALGKIDDESAVPALLAALQDTQEGVRYAAAEALGRMEEESAIVPLTALLRHSDECMRETAACALSCILKEAGEEKTAEVLERSGNDPLLKAALQRIEQEEAQERQVEDLRKEVTLSLEGPRTVYAHKSTTQTIRVANQSEKTLHQVRVTHTPHPTWEYVQSSPRGCIYPCSKEVRWELGDIIPGDSAQISIELRSAGRPFRPVEDMVRLESQELTLTASILTKVMWCGGGLHLATYDTEDPVEVGKYTTYVVEARNVATSPITNLEMENTVDYRLEFVEARGPTSYKVEGDKVIFAPVPILQPGEKAVYEIRCRAVRVGPAKNRAACNYDQWDTEIPIRDEEPTSIY